MNRNFMKWTCLLSSVAAVALASILPASAQSLSMYISAPDLTTTPFSGATTETFDELTPGTYKTSVSSSIGTYAATTTNPLVIVSGTSGSNAQYGAGSNYFTVGSPYGDPNPVTLNLSSSASYFGFEWLAGDASNGISFYNGNTFLGRFSTASLTTLLSSKTLTSIDGQSIYNSSAYKGSPNGGTDASEPFAFVHIIDNTGTFNKIVFDNSNGSSGFESDNHTVISTAPQPLGSFVYVTGIPESGTLVLLGIGVVGMVGLVQRFKTA